MSMTNPAQTSSFCPSTVFAPNGDVIDQVRGVEGLITVDLDAEAPELDVALTKARPWRASVATDPAYATRALNDPRSVDRTCI